MENIDKFRYPIGKFLKPAIIHDDIIKDWIGTIESFPKMLRDEAYKLTEADLEKRYRPNGWTIRQIIHHCADSHMNSFIRFKLALTEETPVIKPYAEELWAELADTKSGPVESSLKILEGLHERWVQLINSLSGKDLEKQFKHPQTAELISLKTNIGLYAWHCEHHLAHVRGAKLKSF